MSDGMCARVWAPYFREARRGCDSRCAGCGGGEYGEFLVAAKYLLPSRYTHAFFSVGIHPITNVPTRGIFLLFSFAVCEGKSNLHVCVGEKSTSKNIILSFCLCSQTFVQKLKSILPLLVILQERSRRSSSPR